MATPTADTYSVASGQPVAGGRYRLPAWRRAMAANTWAQIGNTPEAINPALDPSINPNYPANPPWHVGGYGSIIASWCGGAWDSANHRLFVWGGGHTDYAGNELISIDLNVDNPAWLLRRKPTGAIGNTGTLDDGSEGSGVYFDGRPRSQHTYGQLVVIDGDLWVMPGGSQYKSGGATVRLHRFNVAAGDWDYSQVADSNVYNVPFYGGSCDYDTTRGLIWTGGYNNFNKYDPASHVWTKISGFPGGWSGGYFNIRRCPLNDLIVVFWSGGSSALYDPTLNTWTAGITQSGTGPDGYALGICGMVWDSINSRFIVWTTGEDLYTLTPPASNPKTNAWTWATISADASNTVTPTATANGTYNRFFFSERLRIVGCINSVSEQVHVFSLD